MNIGEQIKYYRKRSGITQQKLAELIGVQASAISKYEKGIVSPSWEMLLNISIALNISITQLIEGSSFGDDGFNPAEDIKINPEKYSAETDENGKVIAYKLNSEKETLLIRYETLNKLGRREANNYIAYLSTRTEYTKPDEE